MPERNHKDTHTYRMCLGKDGCLGTGKMHGVCAPDAGVVTLLCKLMATSLQASKSSSRRTLFALGRAQQQGKYGY